MNVRLACVLGIAMLAPLGAQWRDRSPHEVRFVTVGGATRLEVLDWGGSGRPILFVGCYLTAHVYDEIAPKLTGQFHVYAVTRRGVGASDHPPTGYDPQRRADDILDVIGALGLRSPILIGNSCGGAILHVLGARHPDRIGGLMYLDAAEDPTLKLSDYDAPPVDTAHLPQRVERSSSRIPLPEAEMHQLERWPLDPAIRKAITEDNNVRPDYAHIAVPALVIFRTRTWNDVLAEFPPKNDAERAALAERYAAAAAMLARWESDVRTGVPRAQIVELPGANLYMFLSNEADVIRELRGFAASLPAVTSSDASRTITEADCTASKLGTAIPATAIGEPVGAVTLSAPRWIATTDALPARCEVDGSMAPAVPDPRARPIEFRVWLPATWNERAAQQGGGGMNGSIPDLTGRGYPIGGRSPAQLGFVTYGSDSGHQMGGAADWTLNDEAIRNLGYMQMKKTHDAAMVLIQRMYGERPRYSYYTGTSQGGREALTVAERYPADYDGVIANVPIVNFSSLMLAPELIRIQEKPFANWVTREKVSAIRNEFMRQCDGLDGAVDGLIGNYVACRAIFDVSQGAPNRHPWAAKRCPNGVDPNPADTSANACLTDGQISTLEFVYRPYVFASPLANGVRSFGMWLPNTDPSGSGLIASARYRGQEGAAAAAPMHTHLGVLGVAGFLMRDLAANPLDYVEGGPLNARRIELSAWLDSTNPDLSAFAKRGGKMIVTVGTNDTLASPGAQLDYFQSVIDRMGRPAVDAFARFFVIPQVGHGLTGTIDAIAGGGTNAQRPLPVPSGYERFAYLTAWVERHEPPAMALTVQTPDGQRSMPLCSYPAYPRYASGPAFQAASYVCASQ